MKIRHDKEADAIQIIFNDHPRHSNHVVADGIIVHLDENEDIVALQLLDVSRVIEQPSVLEYIDFTHPRYYASNLDKADLAKLADKAKG